MSSDPHHHLLPSHHWFHNSKAPDSSLPTKRTKHPHKDDHKEDGGHVWSSRRSGFSTFQGKDFQKSDLVLGNQASWSDWLYFDLSLSLSLSCFVLFVCACCGISGLFGCCMGGSISLCSFDHSVRIGFKQIYHQLCFVLGLGFAISDEVFKLVGLVVSCLLIYLIQIWTYLF